MSRKNQVRIQVSKSDTKLLFPEAALDDAENSYHKLSTNVRSRITRVTNSYVRAQTGQFVSLNELMKKIKKLRTQVADIQKFIGHDSTREDEILRRKESLRSFFGKADLDSIITFDSDDERVSLLYHALNSLIAVADSLQDFHGSTPAVDWDAWVQDIDWIVRHFNLPSQVNKDAYGSPSPFTKFIALLQKGLPPELRRHTHSIEALAGAIARARKSVEVIGPA